MPAWLIWIILAAALGAAEHQHAAFRALRHPRSRSQGLGIGRKGQ